MRTGECVLNLPSIDNVAAVDLLARTTGSNPVPDGKVRKGYRFERDKFEIAGLTATPSETVSPPRVLECPVQLEATIEAIHGVAEDDDVQRGRIKCIEARIQRVHLEEAILIDGEPNRIDPDKWRPLIMSFQNFYGLGPQVHESTLAKIPESLYRGPDIERARAVRAGKPRELAPSPRIPLPALAGRGLGVGRSPPLWKPPRAPRRAPPPAPRREEAGRGEIADLPSPYWI